LLKLKFFIQYSFQESIKKMMNEAMSGAPVSVKGKSGKGKNGAAEAAGPGAVINGTFMKDFRTEYAKSGASGCGVCEEKIPKGKVRIGKKEYDSTRAKMYGPYDR
jgi:hypothetical protein